MTVSRRALGPRRRELDPGRRELSNRPVPRIEPDADELPVHLQVLDAAVWLERRAQPRLVDARDEEVLVAMRDPEQLVAHGAPDDVGIEAEGANVGADLGGHRHLPDRPRR